MTPYKPESSRTEAWAILNLGIQTGGINTAIHIAFKANSACLALASVSGVLKV
ncbi:hypothetical protein BSPWISOXPB_9324 [uncultured Gammaproteobacteria bacterium]|nr:hypothetical protein BSPWISOXPB_9324 [uncultured Gammaproteobacteria bacterium]